MSLLLKDLAWAWRMFRIRRIRRGLRFSLRKAYDNALRPSSGSNIVSYPDAIYFFEKHDMVRAARATEVAFERALTVIATSGKDAT